MIGLEENLGGKPKLNLIINGFFKCAKVNKKITLPMKNKCRMGHLQGRVHIPILHVCVRSPGQARSFYPSAYGRVCQKCLASHLNLKA